MKRFLILPMLLLPLPFSSTGNAADSRLAQIERTKTIKIAYRPDATPFAFSNNNNEPAGYTIDICKGVVTALERQLNVQPIKIEWVSATAQSRFDLVAEGKADLECGSSTVTLGRMKQVDFSSVIFVQSTGLVVKSSSGITRAADLAGKAIAVIQNTTNEQALRAINESAQLKATVVPVKDRAEAVDLLEGGRADAFASDKILLVGTQYRHPEQLSMLPENLSFEPYAIVLPRGDADFRLAVNVALAHLFRGGTMSSIYGKWFAPIGLQPSPLLESVFMLGALPD